MLCCGNLVRDILVGPVRELGWGRSTWVESIEEGIGGNGANTSYALAKLGMPVRLLGVVGADNAGDAVVAELKRAGVDTGHIRRSALPTAATVVVVDENGARAFLHRTGASGEPFSLPPKISEAHKAGCTRFHLANMFALPGLRPHAASLVRQARAAGMSVSIDTGWDAKGEWISALGPCLEHADLLFVNEDEARELSRCGETRAAVDGLREHGARDIVVKLGSAGCAVYAAGEEIRVPAFRVTAVDTTGAGDCFAGAFLAALQRGFSYAEAARFANAVGALSVQKMGATTGLLSFEETLQWADGRDQSSNP